MRFQTRLTLAAVVGLAELGAAACSLDFDRFDAEDASTEAAPSPAPPPKGMDAGSGSVPDVVSPPPPPPPIDSGCAAATDCVDKAQTCGARCATTLAQCTKGCGGGACARRCTMTDQTCVTQCADSCDLCVQLGGCGSRNGCTSAAQGDL